MHVMLEEATQSLGIADRVSALREASESSERRVAEAESFLQARVAPGLPLDVLVLGSLARGEATDESDLDYLVVAHELLDDPTRTRDLLQAVDVLMEKWHIKKPGKSGLFGGVVAASDLTERIGLEQDTNITHSRRVLILQESVSIYQPELRQNMIRAMLRRYLAAYRAPKHGVPRFLLNDIVRYWRTVAVDYEAKRWEERGQRWGLRYLKLVLSRKLTFAGSAASVLLCDEDLAHAAAVEYLSDQFEMPPLARLAQLYQRLEGEVLERLASLLLAANDFIKALGDKAFRDAANKVESQQEIIESYRLRPIWQQARQVQHCLEAIFLDSDVLRSQSRRYMMF